MALEAESVALELIAELRLLMPRIRRVDRSLADQLVRAANSVVLNICGGGILGSGESAGALSLRCGECE